MIVIDDSADDIPASVAEMEERQLVVAYLDPDVAGTGGDTLISGSLAPTWTVNGKVNGNLCMPRDTWQHWRVLIADRDATARTVAVGSNCEVALMARDGVWRTEVPKLLGTNSISTDRRVARRSGGALQRECGYHRGRPDRGRCPHRRWLTDQPSCKPVRR